MSKNMLIDSAHLEEIRVAIVDGEKLDRFDFETPSKAQIKGNIYLGKIVRVEPSLQAAFVDYGGGKHGFLSFTEIHNSYFQIPVDDKEVLEKKISDALSAKAEEAENSDEASDEVDQKAASRLRYQFYRRYKIQEVIKKRQIILVQVTKEERGTKGVTLTTYISLAGKYCVLMPNMEKNSGISKKISDPEDRKRLKEISSELDLKSGSVVIRTGGVGRSKAEIKKDFDYLKKTWDEIRKTTLQSTAPSIIHEEANIIKRSIRDLPSLDVDSIIIEGDDGYKIAKAFIKKLIPSHSKKLKLYNDETMPLFTKFKISEQIAQIYSTRVNLPSGGYIIINTTEALISIDVNSGKATAERNICGTALKTNLEAATEIARQCRLRDLGGLLVVDFIDMEDKRRNTQVERCLREALLEDKAKVQVGSISGFGLLEFSRQRLRSSIVDANMITCPHCRGIGSIWSNESIALQILRKIEEMCYESELNEVNITLSTDTALYILNNKKSFIDDIEKKGVKTIFNIDTTMTAVDFKISKGRYSSKQEVESKIAASVKKSPDKSNDNMSDNYQQNNNSSQSVDENIAGDGDHHSSQPNDTAKSKNRRRWKQRRKRYNDNNVLENESGTPTGAENNLKDDGDHSNNKKSNTDGDFSDSTDFNGEYKNKETDSYKEKLDFTEKSKKSTFWKKLMEKNVAG
jgi:ribonuclease E